MPEPVLIRSLQSIQEIDVHTWDSLNAKAGGSLLTSHRFLSAFETSGSVHPRTGWQPQHLVLEQQGSDERAVLGVMPLYVKGHSYGEFVFDWAWADAYARHGLAYYPKWLSAVPFTPVTSSRFLCTPEHRLLSAQALLKAVKGTELSSLHVLYTNEQDQAALIKAGCPSRHHTQFHWFNREWQSFDAFLAELTQPKRKKIRAERRKVASAGVTVKVKQGADITQADCDFFYRCYANTYAERGNTPYLTRDFFSLIPAELCLLVIGYRDAQPIACSMLWIDQITDPQSGMRSRRLYGRYWGCVEHVDCLHFELAYYQPIEWAIANQIDVIEGGAQGEHKMARGFTPVQTRSAHWLAHEGFFGAVEEFVEREKHGMAAYNDALRSPFKSTIST